MTHKADLHLHSCLSACADDSMTPDNIVQVAKEHGVNLCALTDHNSALNCPPFWELCKKNGITPLAGLEITTAEQIHILSLFDNLNAALDFSEYIYGTLSAFEPIENHYGSQTLCAMDGTPERTVDIFLNQPVSHTFAELFTIVNERGGLFIPAHINRPYFSARSQLGSLPKMDYDMIEMYVPDSSENYPIICNSDAHWPNKIACRTTEFRIKPEHEQLPVLEQIKKAAEAASFSAFSPGI